MSPKIIIRGLSTLSALGVSLAEMERVRGEGQAPISLLDGSDGPPVFRLAAAAEGLVSAVAREARYEKLDRVTLLALTATRQTLQAASALDKGVGCISIGSSRGATISLEDTIVTHHADAMRIPLNTSPVTTAGNISSWAAQEYLHQIGSPEEPQALATISTSMTCSSAFHSLLVSYSFLASGLTPVALFGGAEACLTSYTIAQLQALRIYSKGEDAWPCRPCGLGEDLANTVTLGEGAGTALLLVDDGAYMAGDLELLGIGWSMEETPSATGISADGRAFELAMSMASKKLPAGRSVDAVILHAPGSRRGDEAELRAVRNVFGEVALCTTKHLTGHTYGASGMLSLGLAQSLLSGAPWPICPYANRLGGHLSEQSDVIAINTAGFGGNAITVLVGRKAR